MKKDKEEITKEDIRKILEENGIHIDDLGNVLKRISNNPNITRDEGEEERIPRGLPRLPEEIEEKISELAKEYAESLLNPKNINNISRRKQRRERIGVNTLKALRDSFDDGDRIDMLETLEIMIIAYLSFFTSQMPVKRKQFLPLERASDLAKKVTMYFAEEMAKLGVIDYIGDLGDLK